MLVKLGESEVVNPQILAQSALTDEFATRILTFADLNYQQLIDGELEIITRTGISRYEKNGRLQIIKCLT
jgi:hypothetical protein